MKIQARAILMLLLGACLVAGSAAGNAPAPVEKIKSVLRSYGGSLGCVVWLDDRNILAYDMDGDDNKEFIVLFGIDPGCSGGAAAHRSALAVLESATDGQVFVRAQQSFPSAPLEGFAQNMERIFIQDGQLWYVGKDFDWSNDARCCPSVPVKAKIFFRDGAWLDARRR